MLQHPLNSIQFDFPEVTASRELHWIPISNERVMTALLLQGVPHDDVPEVHRHPGQPVAADYAYVLPGVQGAQSARELAVHVRLTRRRWTVENPAKIQIFAFQQSSYFGGVRVYLHSLQGPTIAFSGNSFPFCDKVGLDAIKNNLCSCCNAESASNSRSKCDKLKQGCPQKGIKGGRRAEKDEASL